MFCKRKRDLHLLTKNKDDMKLKQYYKLYFKISTNWIKEAKDVIVMNKVKTMWNIIKSEPGKKVNNYIFLSSNEINKCKIISALCNNSFFTIMEKITHIIFNNNKIILTLTILYRIYHSYLKIPFQN